MSRSRREVTSAEKRYEIHRILLSPLTLWPFQQRRYVTIIRIVHIIVMMSFPLCQLTSFLTHELTLDLIIMVLAYTVPSVICTIQYHAYSFKTDTVKKVWRDIHDSWSWLKDGTEREIMRRYSIIGERVTTIGTSAVVIFCLIYGCFEAMPVILDIFFPLNETRPRDIHAVTEYFVDKNKYFLLILCHWLTCLIFTSYIIIVTSSLQLVYVEHICGLLQVANYRIRHSIDEYKSCNSTRGKSHAVQNISAAVDIHQEALQRCEFIIGNFNLHYFVMLILGVASLSLNLFRLLRMLIAFNELVDLVASVLFVGAHFVIIFIGNYVGQEVTDHHNEIFNTTYSTLWYTAPIEIQKLLLFIMQSTTKSYFLNIGNLIVASIEGFAKIVSLSISYFTVIYSLL